LDTGVLPWIGENVVISVTHSNKCHYNKLQVYLTPVPDKKGESTSNERDAVMPDNPDNIQPNQPNSSEHMFTGKSPLISRRGGVTGIYNPMLHQNLSRVMRWFTGRITFEAHKVDPRFKWQRRFYDHIIRDHAEYKSISRYILRNPGNWERDFFY